jgi:CRP/FNR family cyclic AMP-dependent transcriptional regulator
MAPDGRHLALLAGLRILCSESLAPMLSSQDLDVAAQLRTTPGLAELPEEALKGLLPVVSQRRVLAQTPMVEQGVRSGSWTVLVRGAAKTTRSAQTEAGGESLVVLDVMRAPCVISDPSVFDGLPAPASVVALRASHVLVVPRRAFLDVLAAHPALSRALLARLAEDVRSLIRRVDEIVSGPVDRSVKHLLDSLAEKHGTPLGQGHFIPIPLRRRDVACMVNATTETVSRLLAKFERDGLARSTRDGIWWKSAGKPIPVLTPTSAASPVAVAVSRVPPRDGSRRGS